MPGDEVVQTEEQFSELFLLPTSYSLNHNAKKIYEINFLRTWVLTSSQSQCFQSADFVEASD